MKDHSQEMHTEHGTYSSYILGFVLSIALTLIAYFLVVEKLFTSSELLIAVNSLAIIQLFVQLYFFLHFGT